MLDAEQMKRVEYLQQRMSSFRAQVEKLERYLEKGQVDPNNAKFRFDSLVKSYEEVGNYEEELRSVQPENPQLIAFSRSENRYFELASAVMKLREPIPSASNNTLHNNTSISNERQEFPRLPKVRIPVFDGRRENWANYKNKFIALVHSRTDVSDAIKCSQLFDSLEGQALAKISQFDPSDRDYAQAWKTLLDSYDHKRIVAVEHMNAIIDLPKLTKATADDLSTLLDRARQHLHILDSLDARDKDTFPVRIIERCLPPTTRIKWQDSLGMDELPRLDNLFNFIQSTIFKLQAFDSSNQSQHETLQTTSRKGSGATLSNPNKKSAKVNSHTFVTSPTPGSTNSGKRQAACPLCGDPHRLFQCPKFQEFSVKERTSTIKNMQACHNCLWKHPLPCNSTQRCRVCKRKHHTLLHADQFQKQHPNPPTPTPSGSSQT